MEIFGLMKMIVPNSAVVENEFDEDRDWHRDEGENEGILGIYVV